MRGNFEINFFDIKNGFPENIPCPFELEKLTKWENKNGYPISGSFELRADNYKDAMFCWFGFKDVDSVLGLFGNGADGSYYCIWDDQSGNYPIVYMGSEGQDNKILASNFIDFLRLLAIGYEDIGSDDMNYPPLEDKSRPDFQEWVSKEFTVKIPSTGAAITEQAQNFHIDFSKWIETVCEKYS